MLQASTEYLHIPVKGPHADSLTVDQIEVAVTTGADPGDDDWHPADSYTAGVVKYLVGPGSTHGQLAKGFASVFVRIADDPETPVLSAKFIPVT